MEQIYIQVIFPRMKTNFIIVMHEYITDTIVYVSRFNETDINMSFLLPNGTETNYHYTSQDPSIRFFFYYFVFRTGGAIDWSANCKPAGKSNYFGGIKYSRNVLCFYKKVPIIKKTFIKKI